MEMNRKVGNETGAKKKRLPQVRQTLTSKYRMLKANPLLAYELEKKLPARSKSRENLKDLVTVLDSTLDVSRKYDSFVGVSQIRQATISRTQSFLNKNVKPVPSASTQSQLHSQKIKPIFTAPVSKKCPKPANLFTETAQSTVGSALESTQPTARTPSVDRKPLTFKTPNNSVLQDITINKSGNCTNSKIVTTSTPAAKRNSVINIYDPKEISRRLKEWLTRRGKSFGDFHHLKCFGVHTPVKHCIKPVVSEQKENISNVDIPVIEVTKCEAVDLFATAQGALQDLHKLIIDGYPPEQCEIWLNLIKQKSGNIANGPDYWECRAALEQTKGNLQLAVECYKTAIVHGAETQNVDRSLDQLLQKFNLLNINSELSPSGNRERSRIVEDVRNIFKSSIIQFAVQEKNIKKKENDVFMVEKRLVATPVRRSTRRSRSAFTSTPGIQIYTTLQGLDEAVRDQLTFRCNKALD